MSKDQQGKNWGARGSLEVIARNSSRERAESDSQKKKLEGKNGIKADEPRAKVVRDDNKKNWRESASVGETCLGEG